LTQVVGEDYPTGSIATFDSVARLSICLTSSLRRQFLELLKR